MSPKITYESADNAPVHIERDEWHNDVDGFVTAYDTKEERGVCRKVSIPKERVISIKEQ